MQNEPGLRSSIHLNLPASYQHLKVIGTCLEALLEPLEALECKDQIIYQVHLAIHEACTNIIDHAYQGQPGLIELRFSLVESPLRLVIDLWDDGAAFDPSAISMPDLSKAHTSGYGFFLMSEIMDEVAYTLQPSKNHWKLVKFLI